MIVVEKNVRGPEPQFAFGACAFMGGIDDQFGKGSNALQPEVKEVPELTAKIAHPVEKT